MAGEKSDVTQLLMDWTAGERGALDALMPVVYAELHRLARSYLRSERPSHTLQPTALVHEAYLKLVDQRRASFQNRSQFFAVAAQLMRRILVDHARALHAAKRGPDQKWSLEEVSAAQVDAKLDLIELSEALSRLEKLDPQKGRIVELKYFGGLSVDEIAELLGISPRSVKRHWQLAKAWLYGEMKR